MDLINLFPQAKSALLTCGFIDDFEYYVTADRWTSLAADAGSSVAVDADGIDGIVTITTGATDNNEAGIFTREIAKFTANKPIYLVGRIQYAEAATDDANILFGIGEGFGAANTLVDNGAGPLADYDGACWFKVDGGTRWQFESSAGTSQQTVDTDKTAGGAGFHTLGIEIQPISSTVALVTPWIDTSGGNNLMPVMRQGAAVRESQVQHTVTFGAGEMAVCFMAKAGGATSEVLNVDLCVYQAKRG